jgi:hypothetical protein
MLVQPQQQQQQQVQASVCARCLHVVQQQYAHVTHEWSAAVPPPPALPTPSPSPHSQCEQTQDNKGCTTIGVCGKTPTVAGLQDLLMYSLKGLGGWAHAARAAGITSFEVDSFINNAIFSTLTNGGWGGRRGMTVALGRGVWTLQQGAVVASSCGCLVHTGGRHVTAFVRQMARRLGHSSWQVAALGRS